jgi:hypothetical protein
LSGCGESSLPGLYPVKGKILYKGEPIGEVGISFRPAVQVPGARSATAISADDGTFVLRTLKPDDGAYPGEYKIVLTKIVLSASPEVFKVKILDPKWEYTGTNIFPPKYQDPAKTDLSFTVEKKKNNYVEINITEDLIVPKYKWYQDMLKQK